MGLRDRVSAGDEALSILWISDCGWRRVPHRLEDVIQGYRGWMYGQKNVVIRLL